MVGSFVPSPRPWGQGSDDSEQTTGQSLCFLSRSLFWKSPVLSRKGNRDFSSSRLKTCEFPWGQAEKRLRHRQEGGRPARCPGRVFFLLFCPSLFLPPFLWMLRDLQAVRGHVSCFWHNSHFYMGKLFTMGKKKSAGMRARRLQRQTTKPDLKREGKKRRSKQVPVGLAKRLFRGNFLPR